MRLYVSSVCALVLAALATACSEPAASGSGGSGTARVALDGATYEVRNVTMTIAPGEDAWFQLGGDPALNSEEDCVPGLGGGLGLYGELPGSVRRKDDLAGKRLRVEFTGDGDDANFCFVGMGGLAGAEDAWLTIDSVRGDRVTFSMSGTFRIYDENGEGPIRTAQATGVALLREES